MTQFKLSRQPNRFAVSGVASALLVFLSACAVGPNYQKPVTQVVSSFKESGDWIVAVPADTLERGPWWEMFADPVLNQLVARVEVSNQNVAVAVGAYAQARALVREQRAGLFPLVSLNGSEARSRSAGDVATGTAGRTANNYQVSLGGTWEPDVWGRLQRIADAASASAQASSADLAAARLSAQGELAVNYFSLRQSDAQAALLASTIAGYQRALDITQNRYTAGVTPKTDLLQAQTQLANGKADAAGLQRQRAQFEHAIAVLVGDAPGNFALVSIADYKPLVPDVPLGLPSTLLQRRPDIAGAERRAAAANEQIGIAKSAYYPKIILNASAGSGASRVADLFSAATSVWSLGLSAAQIVFNGGATAARVDAAQAAQDQAVARYRQTVLVAFRDVEDQLSATRVLQIQQALRLQASSSADQVEQQVLNRYRSGQVSYTEVITAQTTALNARRAVVQASADRQTTAVALIQSLGGGWVGTPE